MVRKLKEVKPAPAGATPREPGYGRLQQLLREDILEGRIPAGARLKVSEIIEKYQTSTNPAREALQGLEGEGLVVISPNRGARVRLIDEDMVRNIFDIRGLIEPYIMRTFVEFARADDIKTLRALQEVCQAGCDTGLHSEFHRANIEFHDFITDRHFNVEAVRIMKQHNGWLRALATKNPPTPAQMRASSAEHWELVDAVEKGDPDKAVRVITQHMTRSREIFLANMLRDRILEKPVLAQV
ncbi:MAG TPA: GntR family transcriptional regulator [Devosia sp.]|nr:GntR family transcriptional regulator [Devosia sp.]